MIDRLQDQGSNLPTLRRYSLAGRLRSKASQKTSKPPIASSNFHRQSSTAKTPRTGNANDPFPTKIPLASSSSGSEFESRKERLRPRK